MLKTQEVVDFACRTHFQDIPSETVNFAKMSVIDYCGVTLAGAKDPTSLLLSGYVKKIGSHPEASMIGQGFKSEASLAALVNGTIGHVLDYDDAGWMTFIHPTVAILPAALALGEKLKASGKEVLAAYIIGTEVAGKIGLSMGATHYDIGWHCTATLGTIGATVAAGKLLQLDQDQSKVSLGIAVSLAGGVRQNFGTMVKSLHAGRAGQNGIMAANLAKEGFSASGEILESPLGFYRVFGGGKDIPFRAERINLGAPYVFQYPGISIKPYPSCGGTFPCIDAALYLREHHHPQAADVAAIELEVDHRSSGIVLHRDPQNELEAKFSFEYCLARALLSGKLALAHFTQESVQDPEVRGLMKKIKRVETGGYEKDYKPTANIKMKMRDGAVFTKRVTAETGYSEKPITIEQVNQKFRDCASLALPKENIGDLLKRLSRLEQIANIGEILELLAQRY